MARLVKTFVSAKGGVVQIHEDEAKGWSPTEVSYRVFWAPNFTNAMQIFQTSTLTTLVAACNALMAWDPKAKELADIGEYVLYAHKSGKAVEAVNVEKNAEFSVEIKAKNVPNGTWLAGHSKGFFIFYLGEDAVDDRVLKKQLVQGA